MDEICDGGISQCKKYKIKIEHPMLRNIVLFGSRAKGNNTERSDIDMAVYGGDFDGFYWDIKEKINSLLMFDIIQADSAISDDLKHEIEKDGVIIYEKTR